MKALKLLSHLVSLLPMRCRPSLRDFFIKVLHVSRLLLLWMQPLSLTRGSVNWHRIGNDMVGCMVTGVTGECVVYELRSLSGSYVKFLLCFVWGCINCVFLRTQ